MEKDKIIIVGGARDYHVVDWYKAIKSIEKEKEIILLTDTYESEGLKDMTDETITTEDLFLVDRFLFQKQSKMSNIWRNLLKLIILPLQVYKLKKFNRNLKCTAVYHAMPMYYMLVCWLAGCKYIGTPQGSEVLVRPFRSHIYRVMAKYILKSASIITVDSASMQEGIKKISNVDAMIIQNGIDLTLINQCYQNNKNHIRDRLVSIRGMTELYNISKIVSARNQIAPEQGIDFIYPFADNNYLSSISDELIDNDRLIGRLDKAEMYGLLLQTSIVFSIPSSDSSPRSVYEAIFLGCSVITVYNPWLEIIPSCMKERLVIVDLNKTDWFKDSVKRGLSISEKRYIPSKEAIDMFDEKISLKRVIEELYK